MAQKQIYHSWIFTKEKESLEDRVFFYMRIYKEVLNIIDFVHGKAVEIVANYSDAPLTSCIVMAKKVVEY